MVTNLHSLEEVSVDSVLVQVVVVCLVVAQLLEEDLEEGLVAELVEVDLHTEQPVLEDLSLELHQQLKEAILLLQD